MAEDDVLTFEQLRNLQQQEREKDTLHGLDDDFFEQAKEYLDRKERIGDFKSNKEYRNARQIIEDIIDAREKKIIRLAFLSVTSGVSVDNLLPEEELLFDQVRESIEEHRSDLTSQLFDDEASSETAEEREVSADTEDGGDTEDEPDPEDGDDDEENDNEEEDTGDESSKDDTVEEIDRSPDEDDDGGIEEQEDGTGDDDGDDLLFGASDDEDEEASSSGADADSTASTETPDGMTRVTIREQVPEFMGVDMESYGPYEEGEEATIPEENAEVLEEQGSAERRD